MDTPKPDKASAGARICPQCGAAFTCGFAAGVSADGQFHCWCFDLPQVMPVHADSACLCPACLMGAIRAAVKRTSQVQQ